VKVKARAVILLGDRLVVTEERRPLGRHLTLPGGRVDRWELAEDALVREVREETGLQIVPERLLYVAEVSQRHRIQDLNLIFLARPAPGAVVDGLRFHSLGADRPELPFVPAILHRIEEDAQAGWPERGTTWLGNVYSAQQAQRRHHR
jgi:ADP-ribose pyrophosphatase YjhB (NUDIX family)